MKKKTPHKNKSKQKTKKTMKNFKWNNKNKIILTICVRFINMKYHISKRFN